MNDQSNTSPADYRSAQFGPNDLPGLCEGSAAVRAGEFKPSDWLERCLARIDLCDQAVKAFEYIDRDAIRARARDMDTQDWTNTRVDPVLAGAPLAIKDIFNTRDMPNSMGSDIRSGYQPGNDARVVERATDCGALLVGKTSTAEFAVHSSPDTLNPWNPELIAGTSSTGSAVAVACGMVPAAFGTQSAGSISRPSSYNGVIGFKPSFGLIPRTGVLKTCDTLDTIGWITRNVRDARLLLDCLRVRGHNYPSVSRGMRAAKAAYPGDRPWKIGHGPAPAIDNAKPYALKAVEELALQMGNRPDVELVEHDLAKPLEKAHEIHQTIYHKSLSYYFMRDLAHIDRISERFKEIVDEGNQYSTEQYVKALDEQEALAETLQDQMEGVDIFVTLTTAGEAPQAGQPEVDDTSLVWTLCGVPSITLPVFRSPDGYPYGVQLVAPRYHDYALLDFAESLFPGESELATPA